jgi:hypothetical protein
LLSDCLFLALRLMFLSLCGCWFLARWLPFLCSPIAGSLLCGWWFLASAVDGS